MEDFDYSDDFLERVADLFNAFSQPTRLKIIRELHDEPKTVSELHDAVGGSQANISRHLKLLKDEGIVADHKHGNFTSYEIAREEVRMICEYVCDYLEEQIRQETNLHEELSDE